jgi:RNA recognition motif-containing protein
MSDTNSSEIVKTEVSLAEANVESNSSETQNNSKQDCLNDSAVSNGHTNGNNTAEQPTENSIADTSIANGDASIQENGNGHHDHNETNGTKNGSANNSQMNEDEVNTSCTDESRNNANGNNNKTNGNSRSKSEVSKLEPEVFRKVFVGSLNYSTTDEALRNHFCQFGELVDSVIMKESKTGKSRGFGFVTYSNSAMVDEMMKNRPHKLDGRELETKRATPREESGKPGAEMTTKKVRYKLQE